MEYTFKGVMGFKSDSSLMWNYRVIVPDDIVEHFKGTDKRIICTINKSEPLHCALMPNGDGQFYIMTNAAFRKKHKLNEGDEIAVVIQKDETKYGMYCPDFFEELCYQDPDADRLFHNLTKGKQRSLLHVITKVKSEAKQVEKALTIFEYLKSVNGELDFREMNEALKNSRFRL